MKKDFSKLKSFLNKKNNQDSKEKIFYKLKNSINKSSSFKRLGIQLEKEDNHLSSTYLKKVIYNKENNTLLITFTNKSDKILYQDVPESVFKDLKASNSAGDFYNEYIEERYNKVFI